MKKASIVLSAILVAVISFLASYESAFRPRVREIFWSSIMPMSPVDETIPTLPKLSFAELRSVFKDKKVLIIGGTRGVGRGMSLTLAKAGAHVTIVGRSKSSGEVILNEMNSQSGVTTQQMFEYVQGDLSTINSTFSLVNALTEITADHGKFDCLVQTAAVFPDWSQMLTQEDGFDTSFAVAVVGRFLVYRNTHILLEHGSFKDSLDVDHDPLPVVMNVMASGSLPIAVFDRDLASAKKPVSSLSQALNFIGLGNDMMVLQVHNHLQQQQRAHLRSVAQIGSAPAGGASTLGMVAPTMVSTHPGLLKTDLHRGQGLVFDMVEALGVAAVGISEEEAGLEQVSILAAAMEASIHTTDNKMITKTRLLPRGKLTHVGPGMQARVLSDALRHESSLHGDWLWNEILQPAAIKFKEAMIRSSQKH